MFIHCKMISSFKRSLFGRIFAALLSIMPSFVVQQVDAQQMPDPAQFAASSLPKPQLSLGEVPRQCAAANTPMSESEGVKSAFNSSLVHGTLVYWSILHLKASSNYSEARKCLDWEYVIKKYQEAVGHPVTGVVTASDVKRIQSAIAASREAFQTGFSSFEQAQIEKARAEEARLRKIEQERMAQEAAAAAARQQNAGQRIPSDPTTQQGRPVANCPGGSFPVCSYDFCIEDTKDEPARDILLNECRKMCMRTCR